MSEPTLTINTVLDNKSLDVPYTNTTTAEDVCIHVCKTLNIGPSARHLFALRIIGKNIFLTPSALFGPKYLEFDFRIRFKVSKLQSLRKVDIKAYDYYFHQTRLDVLDNKVPDIVYEKCKRELVGLGITDMYRVMLEKDIPRESVENDYKKYIPKEVLKRHAFFIKKPIRETLGKLQRTKHDVWFVKEEYLNQLNILAPDYLSETYKAVTDLDGSSCNIVLKVSPGNSSSETALPEIKFCLESKRDQWQLVGTIEDMVFVSIRRDGTVEINRTTGIPFYLKFNSLPVMWSFISHLDGYYRLTCKWTFNICKDAVTPSLQRLYMMKCHGPVGGEFSYAKLEEKRSNRPGCFIIRESESKYNQYFIDICLKHSSKPKTFKLEKINKDEYIFNDDLTRYKTIQQLIAAYNDENGVIYFQECLPPSDFDKSPLLLCQKESLSGAALADASALNSLVPSAPLCIDCKDLQVYKHRNCLKWNKDRKKVQRNGKIIKQEKFEKMKFPDLDLTKAEKKCRNPDNDIGGPWCFVETEDRNTVEKDYCEIPLCDDPLCVVFTKNYKTYVHFTDFNTTLDGFKFGLKLWSSDQYLEAEARLVLSVVALPMDKKEMENLGASIEIYISNEYCALTINNKDQIEKEITKGILKSSQYTYFSLTWHRGFITFFKVGVTRPIFLAEYKTKNNLMGFKLNQFSYYAAQGSNILWTFPFCLDDFGCDVHTTTGNVFQQYWPLRDKNIGRELTFHIRAFHSAKILLTTTPVSEYPHILVHFKSIDGYTRVILKEYENAPSVTIEELILTDVLDYWNWQKYSLSFFGNTLQIYWTKNVGGGHLIMELQHATFSKIRWFSVCSGNSIAHWTFFCTPPENSKPPPAFQPECSMNNEETNYNGTQDVTHDGLPCLPWSADSLIPDFELDYFRGNSSLMELSYCRDPGKFHEGTYCYVIAMVPERTVLKKYCRIRKCKSQECRISGTGNDYTGTLNISRSRRYCKPWNTSLVDNPLEIQYMNASLFPDGSLEFASDFCRNPSRNPIGPWCYTVDPGVFQESCLVKDCERPEECIIIISGKNEGRRTYILPQWKERGSSGGLFFALKQWDPDKIEGLIMEITPKDGSENIRLEIGAAGNEKIYIFYNERLMKEKTLPHLLASGSWTDFWLQIRQGEIMLGYKGVPHPLFEWKHNDIENAFEPTFISFSTITNHYIGIYFKCDECHTEYTSIDNVFEIFPVGIWIEEGSDTYSNFSLKIRGSGTVWLALFNMIHTGVYFYLEIDQIQNKIALHKIVYYQPLTLKTLKVNGLLFEEDYWTNYTLSFTEITLNIFRNDTLVLNFESLATEPILIYYFSLGVDNGLIIWSVNCELLDIDGPPRDGGWSPWSDWTCTVPCGGGDGFRTRTCSNPRPNIKGKLCLGTPIALGKCNDFECGDISPKTMNSIRQDLRNNVFSLIVPEDSSVNIPNNKETLRTIKRESPKSHYEWSLNGMLVDEEDNRVSLRYGEIFISNAKPVDSGVYVCVLYRINKKRVIFRIVSLSVIPNTYSMITRATMKLSLSCRAVTLGFVYSDLSLKLMINGTIYKDYGIVMLAAANVYNVPNLEENFTGDWTCVVEQKDLHFSWTTHYVKIWVKKAPNLYTNLMEDDLTKPLFGWLKSERNVLIALITIIVGSVILVTVCLVIYFKFFTFKRRSYKRNRRM